MAEPSQMLVWSTLPRGVRDGKLQFSLHAAPSLNPAAGDETTLADFPDFVDWPASVRAMSFEVRHGGSTDVLAGEVTSEAPDSGLWVALVPAATTQVRRVEFEDLSDRPLYTNGTGSFAAFLRERYRDLHVATHRNGDERHPPVTEVLGSLDLLEPVSGPRGLWRLRQARDDLEREAATAGYIPVDPIVDHATSLRAFAQFSKYHDPWPIADPLAAFEAPTFDIHSLFALMCDYPTLMRRLGIVVDIAVPVPPGLPASPLAWTIKPVWRPVLAATRDVTTASYCELDGSSFTASPLESVPVVDGGFLRLQPPSAANPHEFTPVTYDVDGAAFGLQAAATRAIADRQAAVRRQAATAEAALADTFPPAPAPTMTVPALRSQGLSVAFPGYLRYLHTVFEQAKAANDSLAAGAASLPVYAEMITQGFRFDVKDSDGSPWRSLQARSGTYSLPDGTVLTHSDEGATSPAATSPVDTPETETKVSETLFRWDGWSLAAPRPGRRIGTGAEGQGSGVQEFEDEPEHENDFGLAVRFVPEPGTLPRLRFGHSYRIRARTVDLAGNSQPPDDPDDTHATDAVAYGRFDPVPAPPVLLTAPRTPGEAPERLVIRSENAAEPADADVGSSTRHVVPPRTSVDIAEAHGKLDRPDGVPDPNLYGVLRDRDAGDLATAAGAAVDTSPDPDPGAAPHFPVERLDAPYLPDPLAAGALVRLDDGAQIAVAFTPRSGWYDVEGFRIRVVAGEGAPTLTTPSTGTRVLELRVPKGRRAQVLLSCHLRPEDIEQLGIWQWMRDMAGADAIRDRMVAGRDWFVTPYRILELVHAVRQPLTAPELTDVVPSRDVGDTVCRFGLTLRHSHTSTGKVEVVGRWNEPLDGGPGTDAPVAGGMTVESAAAFGLGLHVPPVGSDEDELVYDGDRRPRHEFGDTKHRRVSYLPVAVTNYSEYFTETRVVPLVGGDPTVVDAGGFTPDSVVVKSEDGEQAFTEGTDYVVDDTAGSLTRVVDGSIASGQQVRVRYLAGNRPTTNPSDRADFEAPTAVTVSVPSSRRPDPPVVVSAVPTFAWERRRGGVQLDALPDVIASPPPIGAVSPDPPYELDRVLVDGVPGRQPPRLDDGFYSFRWANTVRLYMERPWWTSGEGELLAVLYSRDPFPDPAMLPYITRWGQDPVHESDAGPFTVSPIYYPNAVREHSGVEVLPGEMLALGDPDVAPPIVAAHAPTFDPARDLWRCDVDIWTHDHLGAIYSPFVQLCIARYQPDSIAGQELSPLVHLDPVQLQPHRWLGVNPGDNGYLITVAGPGGRRGLDSGSGLGNTIRVTVEVRDGSISADESLQWTPEGTPTSVQGQPMYDVTGTTRTLRYWMWGLHVPVADPTDRRLVVEEFEDYGGGSRLVYAETVPL